jgi:hypothetical protein
LSTRRIHRGFEETSGEEEARASKSHVPIIAGKAVTHELDLIRRISKDYLLTLDMAKDLAARRFCDWAGQLGHHEILHQNCPLYAQRL